jgi:hypothetical protein
MQVVDPGARATLPLAEEGAMVENDPGVITTM